jgi:UPF0271 protein
VQRSIDLNCDCGESFGSFVVGDDRALLPLVTSANIACGAHAGDPDVMRATLRLCREFGVAAGAHPGFPDLQGFGRRVLPLTPQEIENSVIAQIGALDALARAEAVPLRHVKAHGALYNAAVEQRSIADAVARAVKAVRPDLRFVAPAGSALIAAAEALGLTTVAEAFADRRYEPDGRLRDRRHPDALIEDPAQSLAQVLQLLQDGAVTAVDGSRVPLRVETICLHGDKPGAAARAAALRAGLLAAGVVIGVPQ